MPKQKDIASYYKKVLNYLSGFLAFTEEEFNEIAKYCEIRHFTKKQRVLDIGETENYFNIIVKGVARKFVISGRKEVTMQLAIEGEFILSEISFTKREPSQVIIETIEPSIFISIKHTDLEQLYLNMPKVEKLARLVVVDMYVKKDSQEFLNLEKTVRERFLEYISDHPHILLRVPQKYIATFLNIKPETFSRLKHLLKKK